MIKSELMLRKDTNKKISYPYIGRLICENPLTLYVLFIKPKIGIVLNTTSVDPNLDIGSYSQNWSEDDYIITDDYITLHNELV